MGLVLHSSSSSPLIQLLVVHIVVVTFSMQTRFIMTMATMMVMKTNNSLKNNKLWSFTGSIMVICAFMIIQHWSKAANWLLQQQWSVHWPMSCPYFALIAKFLAMTLSLHLSTVLNVGMPNSCLKVWPISTNSYRIALEVSLWWERGI